MSLIYMDGFATYAAVNTNWQAIAPSWYYSARDFVRILTMPSLGGFGLGLYTGSAGSTNQCNYQLPTPKSSGTIAAGGHFYWSTDTSRHAYLLGFAFSLTSPSYRVRVNGSTNKMEIVNSSNSVVATSTATFPDSTLYHVEVQQVLAGSGGGSVTVRVNGVQVVQLTGLTNNATAIAYIQIIGDASEGKRSTTMTNFYVYDSGGSINNDWFGEKTVVTRFPTSDGSPMGWGFSTGSSGYPLIDNVPPVDTTYISSSTSDDEAVFGVDDLADSAVAIAGIQIMMRAGKDSSGLAKVNYGVITSLGTADLSTDIPISPGTHLPYTLLMETSPDTSDQWSASEVNDLLLAVKRV